MIIRVTPDREKATSMLNLASSRKEFLETIDKKRFPTMAAETYYEILKELTSAILLLEGIRTKGENAHKELLEEVNRRGIITPMENNLLNDLRIRRNDSYYEGKQVELNFIENKKELLDKTTAKLFQTLSERLDTHKK